jgi:hypothetical protein
VIQYGSGFTVTKTGTGLYTVAFTTAMASPPAVELATVAQATNMAARLDGEYPTASGFKVRVVNAGTNTTIDGAVVFTAVEQGADKMGSIGPQGPQGIKGDAADPTPLDTWHIVGTNDGVAPAFQGTWTHLAGYSGSVRFRKDPFGRVFFKGYLAGGTGIAFTMPVGYRPTQEFVWAWPGIGNVSSYVNGFPDGRMSVVLGNSQYASLEGLSFDTGTVDTFPVGPRGPTGATGPKGDAADPTPLDTWHSVGGTGEPTFSGTWVNYDNSATTPSAVAGARNAGFRKDPFGKVRLRGTVKSGANLSTIFTLPTGYRPPITSVFTAMASGGAAQVTVNTDGTVQAVNTTAGTTGTFLFLDSIEFDTATVVNFPVGPRGAIVSSVPEVTSLPSFPTDLQEVDLIVDVAGTYGGPYVWRCKYRAATPAPYQWHVIGDGPALSIEGSGGYGGTTALAYASMGMPSLQLPNAGVYDVKVWTMQSYMVSSSNAYGRLSYSIGGAAAQDNDGTNHWILASTAQSMLSLDRERRKTISTAALLQIQASVSAGTFYPNANNLTPLGITAKPIRIV